MRILITLCLLVSALALRAQDEPAVGLATDIANDSIAFRAGFNYLVASIPKYVSPKTTTDEQFKANAAAIKKLNTPLYGFNLFIPADMKLVGNDVNEQAILEYVSVVFQRCRTLGVNLIVWGSGGARRVPDGFDKAKATEQFVSIGKKIAKLAAEYSIVIAIENLNSTETNFINTLQEGYDVIKKINHPNIRLCADIYHMLKENESPAIIEKAGALIVHCDLAEKADRTAPGVKGDDFRPYLKALKKIKYKGAIILECRWDNLATQAGPALVSLEKQMGEVWR